MQRGAATALSGGSVECAMFSFLAWWTIAPLPGREKILTPTKRRGTDNSSWTQHVHSMLTILILIKACTLLDKILHLHGLETNKDLWNYFQSGRIIKNIGTEKHTATDIGTNTIS